MSSYALNEQQALLPIMSELFFYAVLHMHASL